jgi:hypothetical protein
LLPKVPEPATDVAFAEDSDLHLVPPSLQRLAHV